MHKTEVSFWCEKCRKDWDLLAQKREALKDYCWVARCPKCKMYLIRYPKHAAKFDPYYYKSKKQRYERYLQRKDLLQPGDFGFRTHYSETQKRFDQEEEQAARTIEVKRKKNKRNLKKALAQAAIPEANASMHPLGRKLQETYGI